MDAASSDRVRVWVGRGIGLALLVAMVVIGWYVVRIRAEARAFAALDKNMREISLAVKAHALVAEREQFPPISSQTGVLFFDVASVYPSHLDDLATIVSPRRRDARALLQRLGDGADPAAVEVVGAESFIYLGYIVENELVGWAFVEAYRAAAADADGAFRLDEDLTVSYPEDYDGPREPTATLRGIVWRDEGPGNAGTNTIRRIREGVERFLGDGRISGGDLVYPAQSDMPILLERPIAEGAAIRVLYMDGHRKTVPYGEFPNTRAVLDALESLRDLRAGGG